MKRLAKLLLLATIVLVIFAAAFLLLDFRFQQAQMAVDSSVETYAFSVDDETPLPLEQTLDLYIRAPLSMEDELAEALRAELATNPYVREVKLREAPPAPADDSVLVLAIDEPSVLFWSPLYARTVLNVTAAYASDGAVDWIEEDVVHLENDGLANPVVRMRGEYALDGSAYGLISGPGYAHYLAEELAQMVNESLANNVASHGRS